MAFHELIGASRKFQAVLQQIKMVAPVDSAVLIMGETGTGKEVIARTVHDASPRQKQRFRAVNCAAVPATLLESEFFGHERGAFTGAVTRRAGLFEAADQGTLFLDEIGDLPLELQPKLLRVLQEKEFERLGGTGTVRVDVRIIAATNQDLWTMVQERKFRADLYYRLNVFPITLPPLRERQEDIPLLAEYFVRKYAAAHGKLITSIPDETMEMLKQYRWPGNIRELQNVIERAVIMMTGSIFEPEILELETESALKTESFGKTAWTLADAQRAHIEAMLGETNGVVGGRSGAAARLGLSRTTLISRMQRLGLKAAPPRAFRSDEMRAPGDNERCLLNMARASSPAVC